MKKYLYGSVEQVVESKLEPIDGKGREGALAVYLMQDGPATAPTGAGGGGGGTTRTYSYEPTKGGNNGGYGNYGGK